VLRQEEDAAQVSTELVEDAQSQSRILKEELQEAVQAAQQAEQQVALPVSVISFIPLSCLPLFPSPPAVHLSSRVSTSDEW
jgi:hypothetical protein